MTCSSLLLFSLLSRCLWTRFLNIKLMNCLVPLFYSQICSLEYINIDPSADVNSVSFYDIICPKIVNVFLEFQLCLPLTTWAPVSFPQQPATREQKGTPQATFKLRSFHYKNLLIIFLSKILSNLLGVMGLQQTYHYIILAIIFWTIF